MESNQMIGKQIQISWAIPGSQVKYQHIIQVILNFLIALLGAVVASGFYDWEKPAANHQMYPSLNLSCPSNLTQLF